MGGCSGKGSSPPLDSAAPPPFAEEEEEAEAARVYGVSYWLGLAVEVQGLVGAVEHNGMKGVVESRVEENGRCGVRLHASAPRRLRRAYRGVQDAA